MSAAHQMTGASALGVPCLTLRDSPERPITVEQGTNTNVGCDRVAILVVFDELLAAGGKRGRIPELWDGHWAARIAVDLWSWIEQRPQPVAVD